VRETPLARVRQRPEVWITGAGAALITLPRVMTTVPWGDSAEFIAAAATLGVPHPSGYPLYIMLGHLFTWIPFGPIAWRVNLLSGVAWVFSAALFAYLVGRILRGNEAASAPPVSSLQSPAFLATTAGLLLALLPTLASQAQIAEVYTLFVLLLVLLALAARAYVEKPTQGRALLVGLVLSLGLFHHGMMVLFAPSLLLLVCAYTKPRGALLRHLPTFVLGAVLGTLPLLYLPLRGAATPPVL